MSPPENIGEFKLPLNSERINNHAVIQHKWLNYGKQTEMGGLIIIHACTTQSGMLHHLNLTSLTWIINLNWTFNLHA